MGTHRIIRPSLKCLAFLLVLCLTPLCFGESVVVRILSEVDGEPLADQAVTARLLYGNKTEVLHLETNSGGEAFIEMPKEKPQSLNVSVKVSLDDYSCTCRILADTDTVLREGVATDGHGRSLKLVTQAPKQIIFLARPASIRKRMIYLFAGSRT